MTLSDERLQALLEAGESWRVEFKESLKGGARDGVCEAVCAFANDLPRAGEPGVVFVGIGADGKESDFTVDDRALRELSDIKTDGRIVPPPTMLVEKRAVKGMELAVVCVMPSNSPPVRFNGRIHVRNGPRKGVASAQEEHILNEKRLSLSSSFDIQPVYGCDIGMLDLYRFENEYLPKAFHPDILADNDRTVEQRLAATKMISTAGENPSVTRLGCLVLGHGPRDFMANAYLQFLRIDGADLVDPIVDEMEIDGTLTEILRRADDKLKAHLRNAVDFTSHDLERRGADYPLAALQQILRNAIMHRDYEASNAPVRVTWFNDRIEVQNPGGPFGQVTAENFAQPGFTDYRNPNLAEAMKVLGYVQRFGAGLPMARKLLREAGHPRPEFDVGQNHVLATIKAR